MSKELVVCIGSRNPSKVLGVKLAFIRFFSNLRFREFKVEPPVGPQPIGINEIFSGAKFRALKVLELCSDCDYGVGVEAGIFHINDQYFNVQVVAIADKDRKITYGFSPAFLIPKKFYEAIAKGESPELDVVVDRYFSIKESGLYGGLVKILTKSVVLREELTYLATVMALIPRINPELYRE